MRELVAAGHDVTMVSQYRSAAFGTEVYGGGPPPPVPGVRVIGLEAAGEQDGGDFEHDIDRMVDTIVREHRRAPCTSPLITERIMAGMHEARRCLSEAA